MVHEVIEEEERRIEEWNEEDKMQQMENASSKLFKIAGTTNLEREVVL